MTQYYVKGNLKHSGVEYKRGDLFESDTATVATLIELGVIQEAPLEDAKPQEIAPVEEPKADLVAGGAPMKTGEPSLDGSQDAAGAPQSRARGGRSRSTAKPVDTAQEAAQEVTTTPKAPEPTQEPEIDPSENL